MYTPGPTREELAAFGLTPEDVEEEVGILPSVWGAFTVFSALATQWRVGASGATGLDYNVLPGCLSYMGLRMRRPAWLIFESWKARLSK